MSPKPTSAPLARDVWVVSLNVTALILGLLALWQLRTIVSWVLIALLLALALQPATAWLTRHGFKRGWAVAALSVAVLAFIVTIAGTLVPLVIEQGRELIMRAPDLIDRVQQSAPVQWADRQFQLLDRLQSGVPQAAEDAAEPAMAVARGILEGLAGVVTVAALTVFMLLFGDHVLQQGLAWLPKHRREHWEELMQRLPRVVGGYIAGTLLVAAVGGVVMGTTLAVLGVPYFLPLGLLMVVFGIIPFLGSVLGAILLVGVSFASEGMTAGLVTAGVYLVYQQVENEVLQPLVQRRTLRMNPLLITLALLAGTGLAGVLGAVLALPIAGAVQVVLEDALARRQAEFRAAEEAAAPAQHVAEVNARSAQGNPRRGQGE